MPWNPIRRSVRHSRRVYTRSSRGWRNRATPGCWCLPERRSRRLSRTIGAFSSRSVRRSRNCNRSFRCSRVPCCNYRRAVRRLPRSSARLSGCSRNPRKRRICERSKHSWSNRWRSSARRPCSRTCAPSRSPNNFARR